MLIWSESSSINRGSGAETKAVLTGQYDTKWEELWLVEANGVTTIPFESLAPYQGHHRAVLIGNTPNPFVIENFALDKGYIVDRLFLEVAFGRWFLSDS